MPSTATAALAFFAVLRAAALAPPQTRLHPRARRPTHVRAGGGDDAKPDVIDEFFPRFRRDGAAAAADEAPAAPTGAARMNTVNAKLDSKVVSGEKEHILARGGGYGAEEQHTRASGAERPSEARGLRENSTTWTCAQVVR